MKIRIIAFSVFFFLIFQDVYFISSIGVAFSVFIFLDFINKLGKIIPIKEFIILIASFQWIVGARISYYFGISHHKYYMYVDESTYMDYVVPSVIFFYLGLFVLNKVLNKEDIFLKFNESHSSQKSIAFLLIVTGLLSIVLNYFVSGGLDFLFYLTELLLYIGLIYLFFIYPSKRNLIYFVVVSVLFFISLQRGMFHEFILISSFLVFYIIPPKLKFGLKLFYILIGCSFLYVIQVVKGEYREIVWYTNANAIEVFWTLIEREFIAEESNSNYISSNDETENESDANNRLNQGWIISKTLENVPKNVPYLGGESIKESIIAALLPRFLFANKATSADGLNNFKKVTGLNLSRGTAMGLSITAEFYANYGYWGGFIAIFLYGIFLAYVLRVVIETLGRNSPYSYLWIILIFLQVVKAETDFLKVFNYLTKATVLFVLIIIVFNSLGYNVFGKKHFIDQK